MAQDRAIFTMADQQKVALWSIEGEYETSPKL